MDCMEGTNQGSKIEVCIELFCSHLVVRPLLKRLSSTVYMYTVLPLNSLSSLCNVHLFLVTKIVFHYTAIHEISLIHPRFY